MPVANLSPEEMRAFAEADAHDPAIQKLYELTVAYAKQQGGRIRSVWELRMGRLFGKPWMMSDDEVAKRLKLPVSEVAAIVERSNQLILSQWHNTQEYLDSAYARGQGD